jgi:hypothetical protein
VASEGNGTERRSLRYIRLAAWLADQPADVEQLSVSLGDIESLLGAELPFNSRFPSWWRNDTRRMHSRAWLTAGWQVHTMDPEGETVTFTRQT